MWTVPETLYGVPPHRHQVKTSLYLYNEKNAILFVEIYKKDGVFDESYHFKWTESFRTRATILFISSSPISERLPWCGGIDIVHTPGHMPGHISLYLPASKTLIAGDAVVIEQGKLNIANPQFTLDLDEAVRSVQRLLAYDIEQLICYHGGLFHGDVKQALLELVREYAS